MCCGVPWTSFHCQPRSAQTPSVQQQCGASRRSDSRTACSGVVELSARSMTGSISAAIARMPAECIRRLCDGGLPHASGNVSRTDRKSVVEGKSVSVSVDLGGRRINKNTKKNNESKQKNYKKQ